MAIATNSGKESTALTQYQMFYQEQSKIAQVNEAFMGFVRAGLTKSQLASHIQSRPNVWGRFSHWLEKLSD